jgi:hypothetical protein
MSNVPPSNVPPLSLHDRVTATFPSSSSDDNDDEVPHEVPDVLLVVEQSTKPDVTNLPKVLPFLATA